MSTVITPSTTAIVKAENPVANLTLPDYMQGVDTGTELMQQYVTPPMLKIVQGQSSQELKQQFGESSVIAVPAGVLISAPFLGKEAESAYVRFVPIFFYPEFIEWNPMELTGKDGIQAIRNRTTDPNSPLANKCRSFDAKVREYPCPEAAEMKVRCQEHLNFIVALLDDENLAGTPVLISFSRTSHKAGRDMCNQITFRRAPLYGLIFEFNVSPRKKDRFNWYSWNVRSATTEAGLTATVDADWFSYLQGQHLQFKEAYLQGLLQAQYDTEENGDTAGAATQTALAAGSRPKF